MEKSLSGQSYKRCGEFVQVSGFTMSDTYQKVVDRAGRALYPKEVSKKFKKADIVINQGRVPNVPTIDEDTWTLGGYLYETGGIARKNRVKLGIYLPEDDDVNNDIIVYTVTIIIHVARIL